MLIYINWCHLINRNKYSKTVKVFKNKNKDFTSFNEGFFGKLT